MAFLTSGVQSFKVIYYLIDRIQVPIGFRSNYGTMLYHFQDKARYWTKNHNFFIPLAKSCIQHPAILRWILWRINV